MEGRKAKVASVNCSTVLHSQRSSSSAEMRSHYFLLAGVWTWRMRSGGGGGLVRDEKEVLR